MFKRKSEFIYITKNTSRDDLIEECRRLKNLICQLRFKKKKQKKKTNEVRDVWKEKYAKLSWQLFKKDQLVYGKDIHIKNLRANISRVAAKSRKTGYKSAMKKIKVNQYKVKHLAKFLMNTNTVMRIYKLDFKEYAFIMWAGRYDFFDKKDFELTIGEVEIQFYRTINRLMEKGLVMIVERETSNPRRIFTLTGTGVDMYNKIAKFTNKFLTNDTGAPSLRNRIQDSSGS